MNMNNEKRRDFSMTDAGAGFFGTVLCLLAGQLLLAFIWLIGIASFGWPDISETQRTSFAFLILTGLSMQAILALFYFLYTKYRKINPFEAPRVKKMPARNWLLSAAAAVTALLGLMFTSFAFDLLFTDVFGYQAPELPGFNTAGRAVLGVIAMGIFPAVFEELIFRGVVLRGLKDLGKWKAVLISSAAFAMAHMSPAQTVHQFLLGIVMGLIAWETGSILGAVLIHGLNNALAVVLEFSGFFNLFENMPPWQIIVAALVTFCAVCAIMYFILRYIKKPDTETETGPVLQNGAENVAKQRLSGEKYALPFLLAGFVITAVVWTASLFV